MHLIINIPFIHFSFIYQFTYYSFTHSYFQLIQSFPHLSVCSFFIHYFHVISAAYSTLSSLNSFSGFWSLMITSSSSAPSWSFLYSVALTGVLSHLTRLRYVLARPVECDLFGCLSSGVKKSCARVDVVVAGEVTSLAFGLSPTNTSGFLYT